MRRGPVAETAAALAAEHGARTVVWSARYDARGAGADRRLHAALEEAGLRASIAHSGIAVAPDDTAAARSDGGAGYRSLSAYLAAWGGATRAPVAARPAFATPAGAAEPLPTPESLGARTVDVGPAPGAAAALAALDRYLAGPALAYPTARSVPGDGPTARLSAPLAYGTIGPRAVLARIAARMDDAFLLVEERVALEALERSIATRDFFLQLAWCFETEPDAELQQAMRGFPAARTHPALDAWRAGATGFPLVDAGARQLLAEGWMHPRARTVAASFLVFDLGVDWRVGRDAWDAELVEDEPAVASGTWQWVAGVGADLAQYPRIYNPRRQARAFDPVGTYVRRHVPELRGVLETRLFEPGGTEAVQQVLPLFAGAAYPPPVVDHAASARAYLRRYAGYRGGAGS